MSIPKNIGVWCYHRVKNEQPCPRHKHNCYDKVANRVLDALEEKPPLDYSRRAKRAAKWSKVYCAEFKSRFSRAWNEHCDPVAARERAEAAVEREEKEQAAFTEACELEKKKRKGWVEVESLHSLKRVAAQQSEAPSDEAELTEAEIRAYQDWLTAQLRRFDPQACSLEEQEEANS